MIPIFGTGNRRREINLGGASSAISHAAILDQAKARRLEREDFRRREDNAIKLQAWWRGVTEARLARQRTRGDFEEDITGITAMRYLVLFAAQDEEALGRWSTAMTSSSSGALFRHASGPNQASWFVLIQQASLLLLRSVANKPRSEYAVAHSLVLQELLTAPLSCEPVAVYLIKRDYYGLIRKAITGIPLESKSSPCLPHLVTLIFQPFSISFNSPHVTYPACLYQLFSQILTIPLIPNRLPLPSLTEFSSHLPFQSLDLLLPLISNIASIAIEAKVHLVANLMMFAPPRYEKLPAKPLDAYLQLLATLLISLPAGSLAPREKSASKSTSSWVQDSDSENDLPETRVDVVSSFSPKPVLPSLDPRTRKRLLTLVSSTHLNSLLLASQRHTQTKLSLIQLFFGLEAVWPAKRSEVLGTVVVHTGGGLIRELYRGYVRGSAFGRDDDPGALTNPAHASSWPPLLFLIDLYTQSLLTMGDDEFFSNSSSATASRNPLSLDELTSFSRVLLNIAFTLYWREDQANVQESNVPGLNLKWEVVRDKVTKCLQAIHARDSRKPFMPAGHWLASSQTDMRSFVDAAIFEEQQLAQPAGKRPLSMRQIAYFSPRLAILNNIPFAIPFETRVSIFRHFVANDMLAHGGGRYDWRRRTRVTVRRGRVAQDGFDRLADADLKAPIEISFIDQLGMEEAGIDGGGVFKEFFTSLCKEVFDTDRGLWLANEKNELYPNPHAYATELHSLNWYRFIGRIVGKALYEGILVDVAFAGFFLAKWLGKQSILDDLASLDPDLYHGLIFLKHYPGNPEDLSLNFTVAVEEFGVTKSIDLIPKGSNIPVTRENRLLYIHLISLYRLSKQIKRQSEAFFEGLSEMIDSKWIRMFNQQEAQILLGGVNSPVDLDDLRQNTHYGGVYDDQETTIATFWKVVNSFNQDERRALLRFVTSCSRPPLLGFKELVPNFAIRDSGSDETRLPTSSTCVNLLKLPRYTDERVLRAKLLQAIHSGAGFDLS